MPVLFYTDGNTIVKNTKNPFLSKKIHNIIKNTYTEIEFFWLFLLPPSPKNLCFIDAQHLKRRQFLRDFMFSIFKGSESPEVLKKRAKQAYEKVVELSADTFEANRMRRGMALLCCAHLDKTFISGAERMADWQQMAAFAVAKSEEPPPLPKADCYQKIRSGKTDMWAYLPTEYADSAFMLGAKYQRTELTSEQAIAATQQLADNICMSEIGLGYEIVVLKFLRQELTSSEKASDVEEDLSGLSHE